MESSVEPKAADDTSPRSALLVSAGEPFDDEDSAPHHRLVEEPPARGSPSAHSRQRVFHSWMKEMASLFIAAGFLVAIWNIIARYDGQPIPEWSLAINLSTLVSLLAVGFRVATISPVAAIMGQQKWLWLSRTPRPLLDLEHIDGASTSVTGSAQLLLHGPRSLMAMVGSTTLLLALGIGPLVQQAIHTVTCDQIMPGVNASIPVANYISGESNRIGAGLWVLSASVKGFILNGLVNPQSRDSAVAVSCSTGNCTWPASRGVTHTSIGLCHACIDTSALIVNQSMLSNGLQLDSQTSFVSGPVDNNFTAEMKLFTPEFAGVASNSISNITMLAYTTAPCSDSPGSAYASCNDTTSDPEDQRALAVSCALYPCIQRFHGSVSNSQLDESVVSTSLASIAMTVAEDWNSLPNYTALEIPCLLDNQLYDLSNFSALDPQKYNFIDVVVNATNVPVPYQCVYVLDGIFARALGAYISGDVGGEDDNLLAGACINNGDTLGIHCDHGQFWLERFWASGASNLTTVSDIMAQFTTVVSNQFRQAGTSLYVQPQPNTSSDLNGIRQPALGTVHTTTVCVSFAWPWLLWSMLLYVAVAVLLVVTILRADADRDQPIWKTSLLPLLFYTVEEPVPIAKLTDEKQLTELAGRMKVQFVRQGELGLVHLA